MCVSVSRVLKTPVRLVQHGGTIMFVIVHLEASFGIFWNIFFYLSFHIIILKTEVCVCVCVLCSEEIDARRITKFATDNFLYNCSQLT